MHTVQHPYYSHYCYNYVTVPLISRRRIYIRHNILRDNSYVENALWNNNSSFKHKGFNLGKGNKDVIGAYLKYLFAFIHIK